MVRVTNTDHDVGRCTMTKQFPDHERCCENYHHCGYQLPMEVMVENYKGLCFTMLTWKCPECGWENKIKYKVNKQRRQRVTFSQKMKQQVSQRIRQDTRKQYRNSDKPLSGTPDTPTARSSKQYKKSDNPSTP